ncbi:MAG: ABC transporter substrate-binding protein, partial [Pseudomonadota bacterium]
LVHARLAWRWTTKQVNMHAHSGSPGANSCCHPSLMNFKVIFGLLVATNTLFAAPAVQAQSGALMDAVEVNNAVNVVEELNIALANLMLSDETDSEARKALIGPALRKAFDLTAMTRAIVGGRTWRGAEESEQTAAAQAFSDWMVSQYATRFTRSSNPKFSTRETRDGGIDTIIVETVLRTSKRAVNLDYRLRQSDGAFKIIDVYLDGRVSEVALRKSEYRKLIKSEGLAGFTAAMQEKAALATRS